MTTSGLPGEFRFEKRGYVLKESCGKADVGVERKNGVNGDVCVKWKVVQKNSMNDKDEKDMLDITKREGNVLFKHGEDYKLISIPIVNEFKFDKNAKLEVTLYEPNGGAILGKVTNTIIGNIIQISVFHQNKSIFFMQMKNYGEKQ